MGKIKVITGKISYGLLFAAAIPFLLILWAKCTDTIVKLPVPDNLLFGYLILIAGALFVVSGIWYLWRFGRGLPMNAFPPKRFVKNGIYAFTKHPIYSGAVMISFGLSVVTQSASGFWLVSPLFTLMIVAYVVGFENERTQTIFGTQNYEPFLSLPTASDISPSFIERVSSYFLVFIPWLIVYEAFIYIGTPMDAISTNLSFEKHLPIWEFSEIIYSFTYLFALSVPLVIKNKKQLRCFITDFWCAIIIVGIIYMAFPFIVRQRDFTPHSFFGHIILLERNMDGETAALPSFHVIWAFMCATYYSRSYVRFKWIWYVLAVLISLSCITTGSHSILDVVAGFCMFILIIYRQKIWNQIRQQSERLSNSWHEWRWGPVRIINHGFYGGVAGFVGTLLAGFFLGRQYAIAGFIIMIFVIIGAGLWAQVIEGSSKLLRPYGYYGGVTGVIFSSALASFIFQISFYTLLASFAMAGPWIQSIGRLRCLVQGCCHGKPSNHNIGIRFTHPYSRVNKISGLSGVPLHPTQLYSIGNNIITGLILIRLFNIGMSSSFIIGIYLILNGLGRFVEESFRGEAQTPYWAGMRIYQWIAIINILFGAFFTAIRNSGVLSFQPNILSLFLAIGMGILVAIASGVDFPESNRRFARLTSN
ncbi:MAG: prolipoprotein diacylglyceryl transferase [Bacteroidales bacterium]|nr:prolipoprotein diacylglyceryl transferase [Bacteroidales bacterium]